MNTTNRFATGTDRSRIVQLDILRGVAILLVMFTHAVLGPKDAGSWEPVLRYLNHFGPTGVDLFFVLSGFLVGGLLFKELSVTGHLDVRRFLIRRGFRIWPSYFIFLAFVFLWLIFIEHNSLTDGFWALLPNLLHLQNYLGSPREHTWSLAVEEHFYLALPFLLLLLTRRQKSKLTIIPALPFISISLFITCALLRWHAYSYPQFYNPHYATHLRIDSLFFGVMLAYFYHFKPNHLEFAARHKGKLFCLGSALLLLYPAVIEIQERPLKGTIGFIMLYVGYGCILLSMIYTQVGSGWIGKWLNGFVARTIAFIGYFSYPIYLWHMESNYPVESLIRHGWLAHLTPELRWLCALLIFVVLGIAGGVIFGVLLEKPSLIVRDRLFPARTFKPKELR